MINIETQSLVLRNFKKSDCEELKKYLANEKKYEFRPIYNISDIRTIDEMEFFSKSDSFVAIKLKGEEKLIGYIEIIQLSPPEIKTIEIRFIFDTKYDSEEFRLEGLKAIIKYSFDRLNAHRIISKCNSSDSKTWRLLDRLSMREEGITVKSAIVNKNENGKVEWSDEVMYALLKEEYEEYNF